MGYLQRRIRFMISFCFISVTFLRQQQQQRELCFAQLSLLKCILVLKALNRIPAIYGPDAYLYFYSWTNTNK